MIHGYYLNFLITHSSIFCFVVFNKNLINTLYFANTFVFEYMHEFYKCVLYQFASNLINMSKIFILVSVLLISAFSRTYPMYKQCDPQWKNDQLGTSPINTICSAGCLMSSAAMALTGTVTKYTPRTLNAWLKQHGGYVSDDLFVWSSINTLGLTFQGKFPNSEIKAKLDQGHVVICNVHNGKHWVLAYGYSGDNILINDPNYTTPSYTLSEIVDGQNGVYSVRSGAYHNLLGKLRSLNNNKSNQLWKMADRGTNDVQQA